MSRRYAPAVALAALGLGLGLWLGLSGGGKAEPSAQAYLTHVSSVCRSYARRLERIPAPSDPAAYGDVIESLRRVLPLLRAQAAAMEAIPPPAALAPRLERVFVLSSRSTSDLETALTAAQRRDAGGVARGLIRFTAVRDRIHGLSVALGIRCDPN